MTDTVLFQQHLDNGLELSFVDLSNRYYGDFYQIRIDVLSRVPLSDQLLADAGLSERERLRARGRFGATLEVRRELKRMGVAGPDVEAVSMQMVRQYLDTSLPYLAADDYPVRLLRQSLAERTRNFKLHG